ncbi:MAG: nuclear transport factor 2 family protein [Polaribacter sp.]|uniref:nuclear transport factor 2 family protein n=1 Tax=Polaribacter sp. TaxID=1920175 RepID=UPI003BAE8BA7
MKLKITFYKKLLIVICVFQIIGCSKKDKTIQKDVNNYYSIYKERKDLDAFLNYYNENIVLEDIVNGDKIIGKEKLTAFFNWNVEGLKMLSKQSLVITEQIIENKKVVTKGYFTPFEWSGVKFEAMHFTTILIFNDKNKIIKHIDWINYPSTLINYHNRNDSNKWLIDSH